jgi:hypothetical protein
LTFATSIGLSKHIEYMDFSWWKQDKLSVFLSFQVLNLLGFICITVSYRAITSRGSWFNTVAMGGFWFTGILLALYVFHVIEKFYRIPWLKIVSVLREFIFITNEFNTFLVLFMLPYFQIVGNLILQYLLQYVWSYNSPALFGWKKIIKFVLLVSQLFLCNVSFYAKFCFWTLQQNVYRVIISSSEFQLPSLSLAHFSFPP